MRSFFSKAKEQFLIYWLVGAYFLLFSFVSLAFAIVTALYACRWVQLDGQDRLVVCLLIFGNWGTVMMAFLNKAVSRLQSGVLPISPDDTSLIVRSSQVTKTVDVSTGPAQSADK